MVDAPIVRAARRVLERERARLDDGRCLAGGWDRQGDVRTGRSPQSSGPLRAGFCYRWRLNLSDVRDSVRAELSGVIRVVDPAG